MFTCVNDGFGVFFNVLQSCSSSQLTTTYLFVRCEGSFLEGGVESCTVSALESREID